MLISTSTSPITSGGEGSAAISLIDLESLVLVLEACAPWADCRSGWECDLEGDSAMCSCAVSTNVEGRECSATGWLDADFDADFGVDLGEGIEFEKSPVDLL